MKTKKIVLAGALSLGVMSSFAAIRAVTPVAWDGNPDCWQMKRHNEKMVSVTNGGAKVVFIGDSITHFWETNGKAQWKKYFESGKYKALDLGTSADRTEHVLWRITEGGELDGYEAKVLLLTSYGNSADIANAIAAGASGALMKDTSNDELPGLVRRVASGETVFSREIEMSMKDSPPPLTDKQRDILQYVANGLTSADIARLLGISADAVNQHLTLVCQKLEASNRIEAVAIAISRHLLKS